LNELSPNNSLCFSKHYSQSHLAQNHSQTVSKIQLKFYKNQYTTNWIALELRTTLKSHGEHNFSNTMSCYDKGGYLHCGIDCDGGQATISWDPSTTDQVLFRNLGKIVIHGGCGNTSAKFEDWIYLRNLPQGDDTFSLERSECKDEI
jgi:hypothetical protein